MAEGDASRQQQQYGDKLVAAADFDGPTKDRHCTDVLCFILIIISWVVMSGIGAYAVRNGDIRLILNPLDYDGNICGTVSRATPDVAFGKENELERSQCLSCCFEFNYMCWHNL